jgi:peptidase M23-like protein
MVMMALAALTLGAALGPIVWLARARVAGRHALLTAIHVALLITGAAVLVGPWVLVSLYVRAAVLVALSGVLLLATRRAQRGPGAASSAQRARRSLRWRVAVIAVFGLIVADAVAGLRAPSTAVDLAFPLDEGAYAVLQGGNSVALNPFHQWYASDRHAVDFVKLGGLGNRTRAFPAARLADYATFDVRVFSPCEGEVEEATGDLPDHELGAMDFEHPPGNHVLLRCGSVQVLLAHLRQASLAVAVHDRVARGQLLGRVGNSGGTHEPHLHLAAMELESTFPTARAVPFTVNGRYLRINDVVDWPMIQP